MIRKATALILLLVLFYNNVGFSMTYLIMKAFIYHDVRTNWEKHEDSEKLIWIHFDLTEFSDLDWEKSDEFAWHGWMYDVKETKILSDGSVEMLCYKDKKESDWRSHHDKHHNENANHTAKKSMPVFSADSLMNIYECQKPAAAKSFLIPNFLYITSNSSILAEFPPPEL